MGNYRIDLRSNSSMISKINPFAYKTEIVNSNLHNGGTDETFKALNEAIRELGINHVIGQVTDEVFETPEWLSNLELGSDISSVGGRLLLYAGHLYAAGAPPPLVLAVTLGGVLGVGSGLTLGVLGIGQFADVASRGQPINQNNLDELSEWSEQMSNMLSQSPNVVMSNASGMNGYVGQLSQTPVNSQDTSDRGQQ